MLAHAYRIALLSEIPVALLLGAWLFASGRASAPLAVAATLAFPFAARLLVVVVAFALGWWYRSPRAGLGPVALVGLVGREWWALVRWSLLDMPWESRRLRPDPPIAPTTAAPIVLAHGYGANRGCFRRLVARLEAAGASAVFAPNFPSWDVPIERYAEQLARVVEAVAAGTGKPVVLVGHSMGGLAARAALSRHGERGVAALVTIASPHHGSALAPMGYGVNARQMRIGSEFLATLAAEEERTPRGIPVACLYTPHDTMVMPQASAALPGAAVTVVPAQGHLTILESDAAAEAILAAARAAG